MGVELLDPSSHRSGQCEERGFLAVSRCGGAGSPRGIREVMKNSGIAAPRLVSGNGIELATWGLGDSREPQPDVMLLCRSGRRGDTDLPLDQVDAMFSVDAVRINDV